MTALSPSSHSALARLVDALSPGATPVSLRRLKGGLGAIMHVLRYETPSRERRTVVLRRYRTEWSDSTPEYARYEFGVLKLLADAGIPASKPLLLDAEGTYLGVPTMVLSYIPGRSFFYHPDEASWTAGLAAALADVHRVTPERIDLSGLRPFRPYPERLNLERLEPAGPLAVEAYEVLMAHRQAAAAATSCLVHVDYWPGNTIWFRGRLAAIIDWGSACLGDPRADVSQCRADLVVSHGLETADSFLRSYETGATHPIRDIWYVDAFMGLRALLYYEKWLEGYHDAGLRHLEPASVRARIEAFVRRALDQAP
jgi:aminoglycoside phosphotransferase (APT) family kinase protein